MRRAPHENVATVLVAPSALPELELALVALDLWVWPVATAPVCVDGPRTAFQIRRRLVESKRGAWDVAHDWVPVWISFGDSWRTGDEPLPWAAHSSLWSALAGFAEHVRYQRRLSGVAPLSAPHESVA